MIAKLNQAAPAAPAIADPKAKIREVAKQFEAVFLRQMISSMRSASLGDDLFGSSASEQFRDMGDGKLADSMAEKGAIGIADMLIKQLGGTATPPAAAPAAIPAEASK